MPTKVKLGIGVSILLVLGVLAFTQISVWHAKQVADAKLVKVIKRNITAEDRKVFEDRIIDLQKKLAESKNNDEKYGLYVQLGTYKYTLGLLQDSKDYFSEAIKINADQYDVYDRLFATLVDMQDYQGAEEAIKKAISIRKGNADLWRKYITFKIDRVNASTQETTRLYEEALQDTALNSDVPNNVDILSSYATWLEKIGDIAGAIDKWKKVADINPEDKKLYQAQIDRLQKLIK